MKFICFISLLVLVLPNLCLAHFGTIIVSPPQPTQAQPGQLTVQLAFCHPRQAQGMDMAKPATFAVWHKGGSTDLLPSITEKPLFNAKAWGALFQVTMPGDHIFYMSPQPYWEQTEQRFIVHHTKTVVNAFDMSDSWDHALGLPVEIIPLTRPYGLYPGNSFTAQVLQKGKALANCQVEVEFFDPKQQRPSINQALTTQVLTTDNNGYFTWSFPWPGWWGMSALADEGEITHNGKTAPLETAGVLWVYIDEIPGQF